MTQPDDQHTPRFEDPQSAPAVPAWPVPGAPTPPPAAPPPPPPPVSQPVYQPPTDPFAAAPAVDPQSPYTAPTYYPTGQAPVGQPVSGAPYNYPYPGQPGYPGVPVPPPPKKRSRALVITAVVLGVLLVLCTAGGVAAYLLLNQNEGTGAATARDAAQSFLTEIYKNGDGEKAEKLVCKEARDRAAIDAKIKQIQDQGKDLNRPTYNWDSIKVENETEQSANTTVTIRLTTSDEKLAEQTVKLELVKRDGWFVCEVREQTK